MIEKIVSGGQTGVDQAALAIAVEAGIEVGGWCPKGGLDECGNNIRIIHPVLQEASTSIPDERTRLNVDHSDGTLIIVPQIPLPPSIVDGTKLTIDYAMQQKKPHLIIILSDKHDAVDRIADWVEQHHISVLNIGGPRESSCPGIHDATRALMLDFLSLQTAMKLHK